MIMGQAKSKLNTWRKAVNKVSLIGSLVECNLEVKEFDASEAEDTRTVISGEISIRVESEIHIVQFHQYEFNRARKINSMFSTLKDIVNMKKIIRLSVEGLMGLRYKTGKIQGLTLKVLDDECDLQDKAEFDLEGVVDTVTKEKEDNTKVALLVPLHSSIVSLEFTVVKGGSDYVQEAFVRGKAVRIGGNIINSNIDKVCKVGIINRSVVYEEDAYPSQIIFDEMKDKHKR